MAVEKFTLLCWKNWIIAKRQWKSQLFEFIFPILCVLAFSWARSQFKPSTEAGHDYQPFEPLNYEFCLSDGKPLMKIAISPKGNPALLNLVNAAVGKSLQVDVLDDAAMLGQFLMNQSQGVAGIQFDDHISKLTSLPKKLNYAIRLLHTFDTWMTDQLFQFSVSRTAREGSNDYPYMPPYVLECFITIQNNIDRSFITQHTGEHIPSTVLKRFPYPAVVEDVFMTFIGIFFPLLIVICMLFSTKNIIKNVVVERESQLKETMKMMGLSSSLHWLAWFAKSFAVMIISFTFVTMIMCIGIFKNEAIFEYSNPFLIWLFFAIYITSVIVFCFLISVIFKSSSTAANVGAMLFFVTFLPFQQLNARFYSMSYFLKILYCLPLNSGMGQGISLILGLESNEMGLTFSNLFSRSSEVKFSVGEVLLVMIIGIILQLLLMIYIERVFPGDIGIPETWYFPIMPCFNFLRRMIGYNELVNHDEMLQERRVSDDNFEEEPNDRNVGIRISNLSKSFGSKLAVNKLNLNMYEGQITVLLGHNGAGKTTTLSILTGMYPPSSGTAYLNGRDIHYELDEARRSMGLCPQHNVLFDELTVGEHIIFFSRLKGMKDKREIDGEIRKYVNVLELNEKINDLSKSLSGGMKRKLSIGVALCGKSKIVMCDEPSSGLDPSSRRALWDLLLEEKKGRTILLTTHHMDEADVLGDRIAIMADGQLRTVGSSYFLKKRYGTGYRLICVKEPDCDPNIVLDVLKTYAPDASLETNAQTEAIFMIPEEHLYKFSHIFKALEDGSNTLKISSFGCQLTTLEEVFLKIGVDNFDAKDGEPEDSDPNENVTSVEFNDFISTRKVIGIQLILYQTLAIILKKFKYQIRNYKSIIYLTIISIWFIYILMSAPIRNFSKAPELSIAFETYDETVTVVENDISTIAKNYIQLMSEKDYLKPINSTMESFILSEYNKSLAVVNRKYLIGATFTDDKITAWFNGQPFHTIPLTLLTVNRALLKTFAGSEYDISLTNKPFIPFDSGSSSDIDPNLFQNMIKIFVLLFMLLNYWSSVFIAFYIKERESRSKLLTYISGCNRFVYWLTSFAFDYAIFIVTIFCIVGGIAIFQCDHFKTANELMNYIAILSCYAFSMLPFIYVLSYLFKKHSTGETVSSLIGFIFSILYAIYIIRYTSLESGIWQNVMKIFYWIGLMFAPFSLMDIFKKIVENLGHPRATDIFRMDDKGIGRNILMMFFSGAFFLGICLLKDHLLFERFVYRFFNRKRKILPGPQDDIDHDVLDEKNRVSAMGSSEIENGNLILQNLTKSYGKNLAVNQLCLAVDAAECFGLLGINGAGKTSTFKMMTGDEIISSGDAWIRGNSMKNEMSKVHQLIGYCPQFDALMTDLTGRETLKIYSLLRGIPTNEISDITNKMASELGFSKHLDSRIKVFSGGNKRKLSTALALIGDPSLIFLDEPTTGMDPGAKHQLWSIINKTRNSGRSVVMTSHSMEECEALCTRLAIMVNGEFKCLGSTQHLKNKFSKGFILTVKTGQDSADDDFTKTVQNRIQQTFPTALMKEKYMDILTFHITDMNLKWSEVFGAMERMKSQMGINDYSLTQTSLEQVFLFLTKTGTHQRNDD